MAPNPSPTRIAPDSSNSGKADAEPTSEPEEPATESDFDPGFPRDTEPAVPAPRETPPPGENLDARLDELVGRLPAEMREALDDLFRARFTGVRKLPPANRGG